MTTVRRSGPRSAPISSIASTACRARPATDRDWDLQSCTTLRACTAQASIFAPTPEATRSASHSTGVRLVPIHTAIHRTSLHIGDTMTYETILVETRGRVGLIRLNRPQRMNALND